MNFDEYVRAKLGPRPSFTKGNYGTECRAWDRRYVALLAGDESGQAAEVLPIYHPKRRKETAHEAA